MNLRDNWVKHCIEGRNDQSRHYSFKFFVSKNGLENENIDILTNLESEIEEFNDIALVDGPDRDPLISRDQTVVLDGPVSVAVKQIAGIQYALHHFSNLTYFIHLDDDSFLSIPRIDKLLSENESKDLYMGYLLKPMHDADVLYTVGACRDCLDHPMCASLSLTPMKCNALVRACKVYTHEGSLNECIKTEKLKNDRLINYLGNGFSAPWALGMGFVLGRSLVDYIAANAADLKLRASSDIQLGQWLAPLKRMQYRQMGLSGHPSAFHDYPRRNHLFAAGCSEASTLIHRVYTINWLRDFRKDSCTFECPNYI